MQRLGVLGGTFDPIHRGHIQLAEQALQSGRVDRVALLPMGHPFHREAEAGAEHRLQMCRLALAGRKGIDLSQAGMAPGVRYTVDTLPLLNREYPGASLTLLLGADKLGSLPQWNGAQRLFAQCDFLIYPRAGWDGEKELGKAVQAGARAEMLETEEIPFSSSGIREEARLYRDSDGVEKSVLCYMAEHGLYQKNYLPKLQTMMNPRRFQHTLGVRHEAVRLADRHGVPIQRAALAGLLHDCAKGMSQKEMEKIARKHHLMPDEKMLSSGALMHGPVGAYLAEKQFGIEDEGVLAAIRNHTVGRPGMTELELCIFVADATEPNREDYEGLEAIRALAEKSLAAAALKSMQLTQAFLERTHRPFFPIVLETMKELESRLTPELKAMLNAYE